MNKKKSLPGPAGKSMISKHKAKGDVFEEESMVHAMHLENHSLILNNTLCEAHAI